MRFFWIPVWLLLGSIGTIILEWVIDPRFVTGFIAGWLGHGWWSRFLS